MEPVEVPGGFVIDALRMQRQIAWAMQNRHANCYIQRWTHSSGREVIVVVDLYDDRWPTMSVTNDAEFVTNLAVKTYGDLPVVYRDTEGNYDELRHNKGFFGCFRFLGAKNAEEAIEKVIALHERDSESYGRVQ